MKFLKSKEEKKYKRTINKIYFPISEKIRVIPEKEIKKFFKLATNTSERVLRSLLFMAEPLDFGKKIAKDDFYFWLKKATLVLIAYSYYCSIIVKKFYQLEDLYLKDMPYELFFEKTLGYYNKIFDENINKKNLEHYASGYKEDVEMGYSAIGDEESVKKTCEKDYKTIGLELLREIWHLDIINEENKAIIIGGRIWQAHAQIIRPYLEKLAKKQSKN